MRPLALALLSLSTLTACNRGAADAPAPAQSAAAGQGAAAAPADPVATTLQQEGRLLIDVRTPGEYAGGHVPGSVNIPMNQIPQIEQALGRKDAPAVIFCAVGSRSAQVLRTLRAKGYTAVVNGGGARDVAQRLKVDLVR